MIECSNPECKTLTLNAKFCSRSCANGHSNKKSPKRKLQGKCARCQRSCSSSRKYCSKICYSESRIIKDTLAIGDNKRCNRCKVIKDVGNFGVNQLSKDRLMSHCKNCNRERVNLYNKTHPPAGRKASYTKHGLTEIEYRSILDRQDNCCPVCTMSFDAVGSAIDHDHSCCSGPYSCGKCVRGVLCLGCNRGLGVFKDNVTNFENAIRYLTKDR